MRYIVLVDLAEDGGYGAVVPDLPGCTAMGRTLEDALTNVGAAMRDWAEVTEEEGGKLPSPSSLAQLVEDEDIRAALSGAAMLASAPLIRETGRPVKANLSLDAGVLAAIDAEAKRLNVTRSAMVELMARRSLKELA